MIVSYDYKIWNTYRIKKTIEIDLFSHPSILITGSSGSGKSYALKFMMCKLLKNNVDLTFCNFKKSADFKFLGDFKKYYTYTDCVKGLMDFYSTFKEIQNREIEFDGKCHILIFDEFPAFVMSTTLEDKKQAQIYSMMISELLMLGRSYGCGVWLIMQRSDSSFLTNGARDNFQSTISLGNISKELKTMLYSGIDLPDRIYKVGEGICWIDGVGLKEVKFPKIKDMQNLENQILNRLGDCDRREASD